MTRRWFRANGSGVGWALVAVQGVLLAGIALVPRSWGPSVTALREVGGVVLVVGVVGVVAAAAHLGAALTPLPEPNGTGMRARGAYRWVRHPMYSAVLVSCAGVACARGSVVVWALVAALAVFFEAKTRREERFLRATYPGYAEYAARTGKFLPWIGKAR